MVVAGRGVGLIAGRGISDIQPHRLGAARLLQVRGCQHLRTVYATASRIGDSSVISKYRNIVLYSSIKRAQQNGSPSAHSAGRPLTGRTSTGPWRTEQILPMSNWGSENHILKVPYIPPNNIIVRASGATFSNAERVSAPKPTVRSSGCIVRRFTHGLGSWQTGLKAKLASKGSLYEREVFRPLFFWEDGRRHQLNRLSK